MEYVIDGERIFSLEDFYEEFSRIVCPQGPRVTNLDALDDVLCGDDVGVPAGSFTLRWRHSRLSRERLGYPETIRLLEMRIKKCHVDNVKNIEKEISEALLNRGETIFDWLVKIINDHGPEDTFSGRAISLILD